MKSIEQLNDIFEYLKQFLTESRLEKTERMSLQSSDFILPVMQDVYQFRNAAAIVRSVEACGFHRVVAMEDENSFNPNQRVSKGADTWVDIQRVPLNISTLQNIKDEGYKIVAVSAEKNAISLPDFQIKEPIALVFGTELEGVSEEILNFADETLSIPMFGFTESFNVSVAAGICMYDLKQKLIKSDIDYLLSPEKLLKTRIRWAVNSIRSGEEILAKYVKDNNI